MAIVTMPAQSPSLRSESCIGCFSSVKASATTMTALGTALMKTEMCERLAELGRHDELAPTLGELRSALEETVVELRSIMAELKNPVAQADN